jgi:gamma-glutamyl phosphate reductase
MDNETTFVTEQDERRAALTIILDRKKGQVCNEFEKLCPTEASFKRMKKEMHNIFDSLAVELSQTFKI